MGETKLVKVLASRSGLVAILGMLLASMWMVGSARATEADMWSLPSYEPARCQSCHRASEFELRSNPSLASQLNPFGVDWKTAGRVWGPDIAKLDSDGDRCLNGAELGDFTGTDWAQRRGSRSSPSEQQSGDHRLQPGRTQRAKLGYPEGCLR